MMRFEVAVVITVLTGAVQRVSALNMCCFRGSSSATERITCVSEGRTEITTMAPASPGESSHEGYINWVVCPLRGMPPKRPRICHGSFKQLSSGKCLSSVGRCHSPLHHPPAVFPSHHRHLLPKGAHLHSCAHTASSGKPGDYRNLCVFSSTLRVDLYALFLEAHNVAASLFEG